MLIGEYVKWTDDIELLEMMLPHIRRALEWIDKYGSRDGSGGFVAYSQQSEKGIANQGWKDSGNSVVHRNGAFAKAPIALVEVQGYVYQAKRNLAELLDNLREKSGATDWEQWSERLKAEAEALREQFEQDFWVEADRFYALALDEAGKQVETVTSNPGHALMSRIMQQERAEDVANKLLSKAMFSGYGIRTMAEGEKAYNPMSYHNGSVWPHDNSLCLLGLNEMGFHNAALTVMEGLLRQALISRITGCRSCFAGIPQIMDVLYATRLPAPRKHGQQRPRSSLYGRCSDCGSIMRIGEFVCTLSCPRE